MRTLDAVVNLWTPEVVAGYTPKLDAFWRQVRILGETHEGIPLIHRVVEAHPRRFRGIVGLNPSRIVPQLAELDHAVRELGFVGAHVYPHWFGKPPDDRIPSWTFPTTSGASFSGRTPCASTVSKTG